MPNEPIIAAPGREDISLFFVINALEEKFPTIKLFVKTTKRIQIYLALDVQMPEVDCYFLKMGIRCTQF